VAVKVAVVHDWLYVLGGAERVLKQILRCYPQADLFTLFDVLSERDRQWLGVERTHTTFFQKIPGIAGRHRLLLPFMPYAIEQIDLSDYDLVISSSCAVAKGVITGPDQIHISYVHSPMRYAWDLQNQYVSGNSNTFFSKSLLTRMLLHRMRVWDTVSGNRPNAIIANSNYIARRIKKAFGRDAHVIYPPVDVAASAPANARRGEHFLAGGRLVKYKNVQAVVEAFALLPDKQLVVVGEGPEEAHLRSIATPNVAFAGFMPDSDLHRAMAASRAFIFASEEDFGIMPVEALAEGTPVLALGRGGARESIVAGGPNPTGMFFDDATAEDIAGCVRSFIRNESLFNSSACRARAQMFTADRFCTELKSFVDKECRKLKDHGDYAIPSRVVLQTVAVS
jgi:glycosyltransferase involved in cell wall biosynthesis